ncbi:MAG: DUF5615 family PIN-like protein [Acidobacteriota bacterium]|nr:DUF5615 family PIN-like protein [Acidobacteriota bacterium]
MKIRFQADNDLNRVIVQAVLRLEPMIDFQTAQQARLDGVPDVVVLAQAAMEQRVLVSHDLKPCHAPLPNSCKRPPVRES